MPSTDALPELDAAARHWLLQRARLALQAYLGATAPVADQPALPAKPSATLQHPAACFVTLTRDGQLRGCIGTLCANEPLAEAVVRYAEAAAFEDPRFAPLSRAELSAVRIEISLLSPPRPLHAPDEAALLAQLHPGIDGLTITHGAQRATFLPQVWQQLPEPAQFLRQLKRKAGLADEFPVGQLLCESYTVISIAE